MDLSNTPHASFFAGDGGIQASSVGFNSPNLELTSSGDIHIYQNHFSRILSSFAFSGNAKPGRGVYVFRNVFDLRRPVHGSPPAGPDSPTPSPRPTRPASCMSKRCCSRLNRSPMRPGSR